MFKLILNILIYLIYLILINSVINIFNLPFILFITFFLSYSFINNFNSRDKMSTYKQIKYNLPKTFLYNDNINLKSLKYPIIFKPNNGNYSTEVQIINNLKEANDYLNKTNNEIIIQEFVPYNNEVGIYVYKNSIYNDYNILSIIKKNDKNIIKPGCSFTNQSNCIDLKNKLTKKLKKKIINITKNIKNITVGRYDIKYKSLKHLLNGEFYILEFNKLLPVNYQMSMNEFNPFKFIYYNILTFIIIIFSTINDIISKFI